MKGMVYKMDLKQLNELLDLALEQPEEVEHEEIHKNKLAAAIHASISEEEGAIAAYEKRAAKCRKHGNEEMAKMFQELADDEKVHSAQLQKALKLLNLNNQEKEEEGEEEAEEMLGNANESLKEEYEAGDSIYLTIEHIKDDLYELDGVQFYKGEDEELQNAVEVCIDEEYLPDWQTDDITGYFVQSFEYDQESGTGEIEIVLE